MFFFLLKKNISENFSMVSYKERNAQFIFSKKPQTKLTVKINKNI